MSAEPEGTDPADPADPKAGVRRFGYGLLLFAFCLFALPIIYKFLTGS